MKEVSLLLLLALLLNGCSSSSSTTGTTQTPGDNWQAQMSGGVATSSGFSFTTEFTIGGNGALSISNFQFLNQEQDTCFGTASVSESGNLNVTFNSADQVSGTFAFTITTSAGDTLALSSSDITGTESSATALTGATVTGDWTLTPVSGSNCVATSGQFTMKQS